MAQRTVLRHPDVAQAGAHRRPSDTGWSDAENSPTFSAAQRQAGHSSWRRSC